MGALTGKKAIRQYARRSWETLERWINERGYPVRKIDGVWESDTRLIDEWRMNQIMGGVENGAVRREA